MALVSCEGCGRSISDKARACPGCDRPRRTSDGEESSPPAPRAASPPAPSAVTSRTDAHRNGVASDGIVSWRVLAIVAAAIVTAIVILIVSVVATRGGDTTSGPTRNEAQTQATQASDAETAVEASARDEDSSCAGLADHMAAVLIDEPLSRGLHIIDPSMRGPLRGVFLTRCDQDRWSEQVQTCYLAAKTEEDLTPCNRVLTVDQGDKLATDLEAIAPKETSPVAPGATCTVESLNCKTFSAHSQTRWGLHKLVLEAIYLAWAQRNLGDGSAAKRYAEAICLAMESYDSTDPLLAGDSRFAVSRAWEGLGCHDQAVTAVQASIGVRPHGGTRWKDTCDLCARLNANCAACTD